MNNYRIIDFGDCVARIIDADEAMDILSNDDAFSPQVICFDDNGKDWWIVRDEYELEDYIDDSNKNKFAVEVTAEEMFSRSKNEIESSITQQIMSAIEHRNGTDIFGYPVAGTRELIWKIWCDLNHVDFIEGGDYFTKCKGIDVDELIGYIMM